MVLFYYRPALKSTTRYSFLPQDLHLRLLIIYLPSFIRTTGWTDSSVPLPVNDSQADKIRKPPSFYSCGIWEAVVSGRFGKSWRQQQLQGFLTEPEQKQTPTASRCICSHSPRRPRPCHCRSFFDRELEDDPDTLTPTPIGRLSFNRRLSVTNRHSCERSIRAKDPPRGSLRGS